MEDRELKLRCMEMALGQARLERPDNFEERVAYLATWFYDRIVRAQDPSRDPQGQDRMKGKSKADKAPEIFR